MFKLFLFLIPIFAVTACGIKPKELTAPSADTEKEQTFPRTYPDPAHFD